MIKNLFKNLSKETEILLVFLGVLALKTMLFQFIGASKTGNFFYGINYDLGLLPIHLLILLIVLLPCYLFKGKNRFRYLLGVNLLYSLMLLIDLWTYRASGYFFSIKYIMYPDLFNPLGNSLFQPNILDILFLMDIPFIIKRYIKEDKFKRRALFSLISTALCVAIVFGAHYLIDVKRVFSGNLRFIQNDWEGAWSPSTRMLNRSPLGDKFYETYSTLKKVGSENNLEEIEKAEEWLAWNNENLPDNEYKGIAKGKNVIFLQIESLEDFVINQKVYGQEITPNLNKLINNSLYFNNIYEQNNGANSIDADMLASTGLLTLGDSVTFLTHPEVKYNSIQRVLSRNGYKTIGSHAEKPGDWGWAEAHKSALGTEEIWSIREYNEDERVGFGLSDESLYRQFGEKLKEVNEPFFAMVPTLSSHGPFDIKDKYRELKLPEELDKNELGGYFQSIHYADKQIGKFIKTLEDNGLMEDTIVVIYGDHSGVHKYYMDTVNKVEMDGDWWKEYEMQIPLIIYGKDIPSKTIETIGGHIDIMPTVAYLLGVDINNSVMGRNLLNTNRNATVIKGGKIIGNVSSEEEKVRLEEAYDIAEYIIKNNYFDYKGKVK
ncbi:MAG: LTA synthase family protein [Clostridium sp.]